MESSRTSDPPGRPRSKLVAVVLLVVVVIAIILALVVTARDVTAPVTGNPGRTLDAGLSHAPPHEPRLLDPDVNETRSTSASPVASSAQVAEESDIADAYRRRRIENLESTQRHFQQSVGSGAQEVSAAYSLALLCAVIELDSRGEFLELNGEAFNGKTSPDADVVISGDRRYQLRHDEFALVMRLKDAMSAATRSPQGGAQGVLATLNDSKLSSEEVQQLAEDHSRALERLHYKIAHSSSTGATSTHKD